MKNNLENGRSMLEMLGVLAVIGVITIGGFGMINKMNDQRTANQIMDNAGSLANKARVLVRDYDATGETNPIKKGYLFTKYLYDGKAYPSDLTYDTYRFYGKNDEYYVLHAPDPNGDYKLHTSLYVLGIFNLSETVCMELATKNWGSPATNGFVGLSVPNVDNISYGTGHFRLVDLYMYKPTKQEYQQPYLSIVGDTTYPAPMPAATAATYCADGATIFLTFK